MVLLEDVGVECVGWFELCACLGAVLQVAYAALVGLGLVCDGVGLGLYLGLIVFWIAVVDVDFGIS